MSSPAINQAPTLPGPELARALGDRFRAASLSESDLLARLGVRELAQIPQIPPAERAQKLSGNNPANVLLRLFYFGAEVPRIEAASALAPVAVDALIEQGVLSATPAGVRSRVQLILTGDTFTTNDPPGADSATSPSGKLSANKVMGVAGTTRIMSDVAIRRPFKSALDMGAGSGLLAIRAAAHCTHVVATDFNPAAASFARFNADLNSVRNVESVHGDLFSAVEGRRFDYIFSNPPFVISPETTVTFRDSGMRGDLFCRRLARESAARLNPGGYFQMICDWPHIAGQSPEQSLATWFEALNADVLVLRLRTTDPVSYAKQWVLSDTTHGKSREPAQLQQVLKSWIDFYASQHFAAISTGVVTLRMLNTGASRTPWFRLDHATEPLVSPAGEQIFQLMAGEDLVRSADATTLLAMRYRVTPAMRLHQQLTPGDTGWSLVETRVQSTEGFSIVTPLDPPTARVLSAVRPDRTGTDIAAACTEPQPTTLTALQTLLRRGIITPP